MNGNIASSSVSLNARYLFYLLILLLMQGSYNKMELDVKTYIWANVLKAGNVT